MDHNTSHISLISKVDDKQVDVSLEERNSTSDNTKVEKIITLAKSKMGDSYAACQSRSRSF